jgi:protein O-mannosyl-transferase
MQSNARKTFFIAAFSAALICLLVYSRSLWCGFINLDDSFYIENNPLIKRLDGKTLLKIFTEPHLAAWIPLTYVTFALDYHFWGLNPIGYHLTNILLHAVNTLLVVLLADRLFQYLPVKAEVLRSDRFLYPAMLLLSGLLFGIHPLRVESVAWVAERKDVLNGLFSLGSVLFYLRYVQKKALSGEKRAAGREYCISIGLFSLSLMAKQVSVVLPVMLLVIDWYPLRRVRKGEVISVLVEKLPYVVLSLAVSFLTIHLASKGNIMVTVDDFPFYARCLVSGTAIFEYCRYLLYPVGIVPFFVIGDTIQYSFMVKTAVVVAFTFFCIGSARKRPYLSAAWFSFLIPLLPVLAFTQSAEDTFIAARYTYLPSIAPSITACILLAIGYQSAAGVRPGLTRILLPTIIASLIFGYVAMTLRLISSWKDPGTLWTRQIEIQPLGRAYNYRGIYYYSIGKYAAALDDFSTALKIAQQAGREDIFNLFAYRGDTLRALGLHEEAIEDLTVAINLSHHPQYYYLRGCSLKALGRLAEAENDFRLAGNQTGPIPWFPTIYNHGR